MSFLDPFLDAFADLDDSINEEIPGGWGTIAALTAAAMTGGASAGATGGVDAAAMGSWDILPAVGEGVTAITPQTIGAAGAMAPYETAVPGIMGATGTPVVSGATPMVPSPIGSLPPSPTNFEAVQQAATTTPVTTPPPAGDPTLTARGISSVPTTGDANTDNAAQNAFRKQIGEGAVRTTLPTAPVGAPPVADPYSVTANYNLTPQAGTPATNSMAGNYGTGIKAEGAQIAPPSMFDKAAAFAKESPWIAGGLGYLGAYNLGLLDPRNVKEEEKYNGVLTKYKMSPNFQASNAQPNVYRPTYAAAGGIMQAGGPVEQMSMNAIGGNQGYPQSGLPYSGYASPTASPIPQNVVQGDAGDVGVNPQTGQERFAQGGVAHFRRGGSNLADSLDFYKSMTESRGGKGYSGKSDPGASYAADIYYDMDPDTRYQDALTAAQIRQAKINKRSNVEPPVAKRPTPMGQLNLRPPGAQAAAAGSSLDPEMAAQGGIMHSSLGGYAAGGNPRLLKGPGDGMSDNIPATIANKQPARLADGEFVIPADVVSHLGNGSTEAGAKRLHEMMNKVRKARTGNPKQGKQINPNKFMPA
jgi:hypothetical protein